MSKYNWPETPDGIFYSILSKSGDGSRLNPYPLSTNPNVRTAVGNGNIIISSGQVYMSTNDWANSVIYGRGSSTVLNLNTGGLGRAYVNYCRIRTYYIGGYGIYPSRCILETKAASMLNTGGTVSSCVVLSDTIIDSNANSYRNTIKNVSASVCPTGSVLQNMNVLDGLKLDITQSILNTYKNNYAALNDCKFKIGNESDYTALTGSTEEQLRQNFTDRCKAQGISVPTGSEYGDNNMPMYRWVFSVKSLAGYRVIANSIIDAFQKRRYLSDMGGFVSVDNIPIVPGVNTPHSLGGQNKSPELVIANNTLRLSPTFDITKRAKLYHKSNIIWLGGLYKLSEIDIFNNLPVEYGVMPDSTWAFDETPVTQISANELYIVRSSNAEGATVRYNNQNYVSALRSGTNIFRGVNDQTTFTDVSGNALVYRIADQPVHQTIRMRIVSDIPAAKITSGNLAPGYWYYIAPDSQNDTTGTVKYNNITYPCFGSFLVQPSVVAFEKSGNVHLRRCWQEDFKIDNEVTDKAFWKDKQKPIWFDVVLNDLRCQMKDNSEYADEMMYDAELKTYIASGHPDFYNNALGQSGVVYPVYPVKGAFVQFYLEVSTLNPM